MKMFSLLVLLSSISFVSLAQLQINGSFEALERTGKPKDWDLTFNNKNTYTIQLDSLIKTQGKYSISISADNKPVMGNAIVQSSTQKLNGKLLSLVGSIKTENVSEGWAGLWMRVDGGEKTELAYNMMESQSLKGTNDWKEYVIQIPYDQVNARSIHFGGLLFGKGKMWLDDLKLYLDGASIDKIIPITPLLTRDTLYDQSSKIDTIQIMDKTVQYLSTTGKLWGFLKYHHPAVTNGKYDWDRQLFEHLPAIVKTRNDSTFSYILENWIDNLGAIPETKSKKNISSDGTILLEPDYSGLFSDPLLKASLKTKLQNILNSKEIKESHYVSLTSGVGNPVFENEKLYVDKNYPDAGVRLLALYRYWAMVQYFCPNRKLTQTDWNDILPEYIPEILKANDKRAYTKVLVRLVCSIRDGHGFLSSKIHQESLGKFRLPLEAAYVENHLVITKYLSESQSLRNQIGIGEVINKINGKPVSEMIKEFTAFTPGSNFSTIMRDMPGNYLLRADQPVFRIETIRNGITVQKTISGIKNGQIDPTSFTKKSNNRPYYLLEEKIGYIQGDKLKKEHMDSLKLLFEHTKGMIIDMRGYPIDDLIASIGTYIRDTSSPFTRFAVGSIAKPGLFTLSDPYGGRKPGKNFYKGKVVILVNEITQSNAEFVTMAFQTGSHVKVIGSTTAGADGNISRITLPGGFSTYFSGIGVYYPDRTDAQQKGIKIDQVIRPTVKGILAGKDELLEKATALIKTE